MRVATVHQILSAAVPLPPLPLPLLSGTAQIHLDWYWHYSFHAPFFYHLFFKKLFLHKEINISVRDHHVIIGMYSCVLMWSWLGNVKLENLACSSTTQVFTQTITSYALLFFFVLDVDRWISSKDSSQDLQKQDCTNKHKLHKHALNQ